MKTKYSRLCILSELAGGLALVSGCVVEPGTVRVAPVVVGPPVVAVTPPVVDVAPPAVEVAAPVVEVPDSYVWDGVEFVGVVGDGYFYLGPGDVWVACDPVRLGRFHDWERIHPDWRVHVIRNDRFRKDARGEFHPMGHGEPERTKAAQKPREDKPQPTRHADDVHQGHGGPETTRVAQKPNEAGHHPGHAPERTKASQKPKDDEHH